jgi:hypothetical protein
MSTGDKIFLALFLASTAWFFLVYAPKNRRDRMIGDVLEDLAEDEFGSAF